MPTKAWPPSLLAALARHGRGLHAGAEFDGRLASAVLAYARERSEDGLRDASVRGMVLYPGRAVLNVASPGVRLDALDVDAVRALVMGALDAGLSPRTIKGKHLQLLRLLFQRFGVPDVTGEVKRRLRSVLAVSYTPPPRLTSDDFADMFRRIEEYPARLRTRRRDLAVIRILALRAIRTGEFCRVRIERDVHLEVPCLDIREPKVRRLARRVELSAQLADDVRTLMGDRESGPLVLGGERIVNSILERWKWRLGEPRLNQRHLRRSCASQLAYNGAELPVVRHVLGHARNSAQTLGYMLTDEQRTREALRTLEHHSRPYPGTA